MKKDINYCVSLGQVQETYSEGWKEEDKNKRESGFVVRFYRLMTAD